MSEDLFERVGRRFGNLSELPPELLEQIPAMRNDHEEEIIIDVISNLYEGIASIDEILVGVFRYSGKIMDRKKLSAKLYRMAVAQPRKLGSVAKKRGVYRLP